MKRRAIRTGTKTGSRAKRSRTRSGCYTCRDRHMKCDEQLPVCQNCLNSKRRCVRGMRLNFTTYNYYDPHVDASQYLSPAPTFFRVVDQSLAVAKLYKYGAASYKLYRHLHSQAELIEADRLFKEDLWINKNDVAHKNSPEPVPENEHVDPNLPASTSVNSDILLPDDLQFLDSWQFHGVSETSPSGQTGKRPRISENVDIKRILMNPQLHDMQLDGAMHATFAPKVPIGLGVTSPSTPVQPQHFFAAKSSPNFQLEPKDAYTFIRMIRVQKYFWVLDLFNDLRIWESCIPSYCVRLHQASEINYSGVATDEKFLFNCLLLCDENSDANRVAEMCQLQLQRWQEFEKKDVVLASYPAFEKVLISIVLIVLSVLTKATQPGFFLSPTISMILANQGRLIHKLTARFSRVPGALRKKLGSTVFTEASFQAIAILRFFLKKTFQKLGLNYGSVLTPRDPQVREALTSDIVYSAAKKYNVGEFLTLSENEVLHLCNDYHSFEFFRKNACSDAGKLRKTFWELVIAEYQVKAEHRGPLLSPDSDMESQDRLSSLQPTRLSALLPNSRCLAINLCKAYQKRLFGEGAVKESAVMLRDILDKIAASTMPGDDKARWARFFDWTLASGG